MGYELYSLLPLNDEYELMISKDRTLPTPQPKTATTEDAPTSQTNRGDDKDIQVATTSPTPSSPSSASLESSASLSMSAVGSPTARKSPMLRDYLKPPARPPPKPPTTDSSSTTTT